MLVCTRVYMYLYISACFLEAYTLVTGIILSLLISFFTLTFKHCDSLVNVCFRLTYLLIYFSLNLLYCTFVLQIHIYTHTR